MEKKLNITEKTYLLLDKLESNGYNEKIISGTIANKYKRHTNYTCIRYYNYNNKDYIATWDCTSYFDGYEAYNTIEEIISLYEVIINKRSI